MSPALTLAVYVLAVARATRLVTSDRITERPRAWLVDTLWGRTLYGIDYLGTLEAPGWSRAQARETARREARKRRLDGGEPPLGAYLVTCPWCVSTYVALVAAPIWYWLGSNPWLLVPAAALAMSYVTGFLSSKEA
jgi:hypothetical protein